MSFVANVWLHLLLLLLLLEAVEATALSFELGDFFSAAAGVLETPKSRNIEIYSSIATNPKTPQSTMTRSSALITGRRCCCNQFSDGDGDADAVSGVFRGFTRLEENVIV